MSGFFIDPWTYEFMQRALIEASIVGNAAFTAYTVQQAIHEEGPPGLISVYGVYLLDSCRIWSPKIGADEWSGLGEPPPDVESFAALGDAIARSSRIAGLLNAAR